LRGKRGIKEMREILAEFGTTLEGKVFLIGGIISAILLAFMLLTGQTSFKDIIEMERKMVESCPFCI